MLSRAWLPRSAPLLLGGAFLLLLALEARRPLRTRVAPKLRRVRTNLCLAAMSAVPMSSLVLPAALRLAAFAEARRLGIAPRLPLPAWVRAGVSLLLLDATMYLWHRLNHRSALLFRFHAVHHADVDLDVSTALRFHVVEILSSTIAHSLQALVVAPHPRLFAGYFTAMQAATLFHHSNLALPRALEARLEPWLMTPRLHGFHHSSEPAEMDSNFAIVCSVWDRLFATRSRTSARGPRHIGLPGTSREVARRSWGLGARQWFWLPFSRSRAPSSSAASGPWWTRR